MLIRLKSISIKGLHVRHNVTRSEVMYSDFPQTAEGCVIYEYKKVYARMIFSSSYCYIGNLSQ